MRYKFQGFGSDMSECEVIIYKTPSSRHIVILKDIGIGTSVTNAAEQIATEVYNLFLKGKGIALADIVWLEHYEGKSDYDILNLVEIIIPFAQVRYPRLRSEYINARLFKGTVFLGPESGKHMWSPCPKEMFDDMILGAEDVTGKF